MLPTKCYAVDTWEGDEHAGFYGDDVFNELTAYHDKLYGDFSSLLRMRFDDAVAYFGDGSIDLLHIDGCHGYESVKHDFLTWVPKLSARGVVLLHDTAVKQRDFGVWRLFEELASQYPVFEFTHGYGLGVVAVGTEVMEEPLGQLFTATDKHLVGIRRFFSTLGAKIGLDDSLNTISCEKANLEGQLAQRNVELDQLKALLAESNARADQLEAQLSERVGYLEGRLSDSTALVDQLRAQLSESASSADQFQALLSESNVRADQLEAQLSERVGYLEGRLSDSTALVDQLRAQLSESTSAAGQFQVQLSERNAEIDQLKAELAESASTADQFQVRLSERNAEIDQLKTQVSELHEKVVEADRKVTEIGSSLDLAESQSREKEMQLRSILNSRSWRFIWWLGKPIRFWK